MRRGGIPISHLTNSRKALVHASQHQSSSQPEISNKNRFEVFQVTETASRDIVSKETPKKDQR